MLARSSRIYAWASLKANSPRSPLWLALIFGLELVLFIPMDAVVLLFCLENPPRRYRYAVMATLASIVTGVVGYLVGHLLWDTVGPYLLNYLVSEPWFERISVHYREIQHWAVFLGALLPLPFKVVTLSAGVCKLSFLPFVGVVALARLLRFVCIAKIVEKWGATIRLFVERHFPRVVWAVGVKIALALSWFWVMS